MFAIDLFLVSRSFKSTAQRIKGTHNYHGRTPSQSHFWDGDGDHQLSSPALKMRRTTVGKGRQLLLMEGLELVATDHQSVLLLSGRFFGQTCFCFFLRL